MRFDKPVTVALGPSGSINQVVDDPLRAGEVLLDKNKWPGPDTSKHRAARRAALKALENAHDAMLAAKARQAFEQAAMEMNILRETHVRPTGGPPSPKWRRKTKLKRDM